MIKELLKKLNWSVYKFAKESGLVDKNGKPKRTVYNIADEVNPESSNYILAKKWLEEKVKRLK
jgi:hypothetical protein